MTRIIATVQARMVVTFRGRVGSISGSVTDLTADRWLEALLVDDTSWSTLIGDLLPESTVRQLSEWLTSGNIAVDQVAESAKEMLSTAAGRDWWEVFAILAIAEEWWDALGGEMAIKGIVPSQVTIGTWLDAAWLLIRRLAANNGERLLSDIISAVKTKPAEVGAEQEGEEMSFAEFMAAANELRGPLPSASDAYHG